jgi:hypothetical protein
MKRVKVNSMWWLALRMLLLPLATQATHANTVDIVHDGYGAVDEITFWGAGYAGDGVMAGVYRLDKTGGTGAGDAWHKGSIAGFCIELQEPPPHTTTTYNVEAPDNTYNDYLDEYVGSVKANYLRELWARYYDSSWAGAGTHTAQENSSAAAFAAAVWEIVYEDLPTTPAGWDVTVDGTAGRGGFAATCLDAATANKWLHELTGSGAKADLRVFSSCGGQDYLVAVPEPATLMLLALGGAVSLIGRNRQARRKTKS